MARVLGLPDSTGNHDLAVVRGLVAWGSGLLYARDQERSRIPSR
jgi:hypothetical protein